MPRGALYFLEFSTKRDKPLEHWSSQSASMDKNEEEDDNIFTTWSQGFNQQEVTEEPDVERKCSLNIPRPSRSIANRRASLPCPVSCVCVCVCIKYIYLRVLLVGCISTPKQNLLFKFFNNILNCLVIGKVKLSCLFNVISQRLTGHKIVS